MNKLLILKFFPYILLSLFVVLVFWELTLTFYQQDEWYGLGDILTKGYQSIFVGINPLSVILGQGRIVADALVFWLLGRFPFNIVPVALFAITFHAINTCLVYLLANKFLKNKILSLLASLFFAFNGVAAGAVTWAASGTGTLPATTLILLGLLSYFKFIETNQLKWLFGVFTSLYISLYFKEIGIFLFIFLPLFHLIFLHYPFKKWLLRFTAFVIFFLISFSVVVIQFQSIPVEKDLFITGATTNPFLTIISRVLIYPLTSFSLTLIPSEAFFNFAKHLTWVYYPFLPPDIYDLVAQSVVLDGLAVFLSLMIAFLLFILFKNNPDKKYVIFFALFIIFSFLPYVIIGKNGAYLENRYYYLAAFGWGILAGLITQNKKFLISLFLIFILIHATVVKAEIQKQEELAIERKYILGEILKIKPKLDQKTVFYVSGDRNFYVSAGNPMPWQQGLGYTLLVWYYGQNKAPQELKSLISEQYLWGIGEQGYKEIQGVGFGYFWEKAKLEEVIKTKGASRKDIITLYYDSRFKLLKNNEL